MHIATDLSPAVICIQETWLKTDHTLTETKIQGYSEYRTVRPKRRGGGVSIYIKEGYTVLNNNEHSNGECGVVHMKVKELNTHIASIYRPPSAKVDSFEDIINKLREWILGEEGEEEEEEEEEEGEEGEEEEEGEEGEETEETEETE